MITNLMLVSHDYVRLDSRVLLDIWGWERFTFVIDQGKRKVRDQWKSLRKYPNFLPFQLYVDAESCTVIMVEKLGYLYSDLSIYSWFVWICRLRHSKWKFWGRNCQTCGNLRLPRILKIISSQRLCSTTLGELHCYQNEIFLACIMHPGHSILDQDTCKHNFARRTPDEFCQFVYRHVREINTASPRYHIKKKIGHIMLILGCQGCPDHCCQQGINWNWSRLT